MPTLQTSFVQSIHGAAQEDMMEDEEKADGLSLPFISISLTFSDICYYVEMPEVDLSGP